MYMTLQAKIGSALVHADEFVNSPKSHPIDKEAFNRLLQDPDIKEWMESLDKMALLPKKR